MPFLKFLVVILVIFINVGHGFPRKGKRLQVSGEQLDDNLTGEQLDDNLTGEQQLDDNLTGEQQLDDNLTGEQQLDDNLTGEQQLDDNLTGEQQLDDNLTGEQQLDDNLTGEQQLDDNLTGEQQLDDNLTGEQQLDDNLTGEQQLDDNFTGPGCVPNTYYYNKCNICRCTGKGHAECTDTSCDNPLTKLSTKHKKPKHYKKLQALATGCKPGRKVKEANCECECTIASVLTCKCVPWAQYIE